MADEELGMGDDTVTRTCETTWTTGNLMWRLKKNELCGNPVIESGKQW